MDLINLLFNEAFYLINSSNVENNQEDIYSLIQKDVNFNQDRRFHFRASFEDYKKAIVLFEQVLKINPNCKYAYNYCGIAKKNIKDYQGSILYYSKAIEIDTNYISAYVNKGTSRLILREFEEAIKEFTKAISLNNSIAQFYDIRGVAKQNISDFSGAILDFKKVIELNPNNPKSYASEFFAKEAENKRLGIKSNNKKPLIIKAFSEMNSSILEVLFEDHKAYQNAYLRIFMEKMDFAIEQFKESNDTALIPHKGKCIGESCDNKGCSGISFVGNFSNNYVDLVLGESEMDFKEISTCFAFTCEDETVVKNNRLTFKKK